MFLERTTKADRSFCPVNKPIVAAFLPAGGGQQGAILGP